MFWCSYPRDKGQWEAVTTVDEFGAGHNDDCGPCANANLQACLEGIPPTYAHMDAIRSYDIANGHFTPTKGQALSDINWDLHNWARLDHTVLQDYIAHHLYSIADIHAACVLIGDTYTPQGGLIIELQNAQALPFNEANVFDHFVSILGFDTDSNPTIPQVFVANGDRIPLPKGTSKPDWYPLSAFTAAQPIGILAVYITNPITPPVVPDDKDKVLAEVAAIEAQANQILVHAGNIRTIENAD